MRYARGNGSVDRRGGSSCLCLAKVAVLPLLLLGSMELYSAEKRVFLAQIENRRFFIYNLYIIHFNSIPCCFPVLVGTAASVACNVLVSVIE